MNVLSSDVLFAYDRKSVRSEHAIDGNIVVFVRNRLVRRLPRPANRHHPCAGRTILERAVIPPSATSQTESLLVDGKGGNNDQTGVFQRFRSVCAIARLLRAVRIDGPVAVGLVLQIVNVAKFAPANIHAGSEPWHQHVAIRIE